MQDSAGTAPLDQVDRCQERKVGDEDLLGSPAENAMPLVISRVFCWQKIGRRPLRAGCRSLGRSVECG